MLGGLDRCRAGRVVAQPPWRCPLARWPRRGQAGRQRRCRRTGLRGG